MPHLVIYIVGVLRLRNYQFAHPPWYSKLGDHMGITVIVLLEVFGLAGFFPRGRPFVVCFCAIVYESWHKFCLKIHGLFFCNFGD